jgi:peptidoglycan/LPS O-acetylase OafA/YrhL
MVVVFHLKSLLGITFGPLTPLAAGGDAGVYIFFALSGYLLYRPFLRGDVDLRSFALKRAARILPGYYVALACLVLLTQNRLPIDHPLPYLTMTASYDIPLRGFLGNAWTLSAEILFYVTLPAIARLARGREIPRLAMLALLSVAGNMVYRLNISDGILGLFGSYPFVFYAFVPGMILAVVELRLPRAFRALASPASLAIGLVFLAIETQVRATPFAAPTAIGAPFVMGWLLQHRVPGTRLLSFMGGASYALYLWHKDLFYYFGVAGLLIALVGAISSWALVERPILEWAHRRAAGWRRLAPEAAAAGP